MKKIKIYSILLLLIILSSCGYQPIYSKNEKIGEELLSISIINIKDRSGQILRNSLLNKINPDRKRVLLKYRLYVEIFEGKTELGFRKDMSATRTDLNVNAKYKLTNIKDGRIVYESESNSISSFDVVESVYATLIAEKDAKEKSLKVLSEDIYTNLAIYFKNK